MKQNFSGTTSLVENRTDWARVRAMKDKDIRIDADSPATTAADWDGAVMRQGGVEVGRIRTRGPNKQPRKVQVSVRYSPDVLAAFRATGAGWQARMDAALRQWLAEHEAA
jgi:uncharacterized protein (DUF4415 family)